MVPQDIAQGRAPVKTFMNEEFFLPGNIAM
jgi:hypothetical protein